MTALRWVLVLPASFGAYIALQLLFVVLSLLLVVPEWLNRGISQTIATIFCPYYFVYIGSKIAPDGRLYVAASLTVVLSVLYGMVLFFGLIRPTSGEPAWWLIVSLVIGLASSVFAVVRVQTEETSRAPSAPGDWLAATSRVLANVCGIIYAYGYFGQAVLFLSMFWTPVLHNWLNLLNPLLYIITVFGMLFTWYFWVLVATAAVGYFGMEFFSKRAGRLEPRTAS
ncbi:MAG TPA: hypothetical protein VII30_11700 [Gemmatimonadaceae bacterium]|jgi:hypothetical protein